MKRSMSLFLALLLTVCLSSGALALDYKVTLGNESTFETMTEVQQNEAAAMQPFFATYVGKVLSPGRDGTYVPHPVMADYPGDTTYVYRSADMYGINAAVRINTNFVVYVDQNFETKADALQYLKDLGLVDLVEAARGSIVLVTPNVPYGQDSSGNRTGGFGDADQMYYYMLQTAMFSLDTNEVRDGVTVTYVDANYYGGYSYLYVIGIDGGATFLNNFVASNLDYVSRIAGMLLINGEMDRIRDVAAYVPVYLVNASGDTVAKYEKANGTDALLVQGEERIAYNQAYPLRRVVTRSADDADIRTVIQDAYYHMFTKAQRGHELMQGLYSASTPYHGYTADNAPYSLSPRNAIFGDRTLDGIVLKEVKSEMFSDIQTDAGEYLQTWFEFLPEEALDGTAPDGTIPLLLALHGGGDDPRQYVAGQGWLELAGKERLAIVAPEKQELHTNASNGEDYLSQVLPELVKYMLATYPALDASRVYVNGLSMGALATLRAAFGAPELFAAAYPQSGSGAISEADAAKFENVDLPFAMSTTEYNMGKADTVPANVVSFISQIMVLDGMEPLPTAMDYEAYPLIGFKADIYNKTTIHGDYVQHTWYMVNDDGIPMVNITFVESIVHCLYPQYANMVWDFFKHYSRNQETGAIEYDPYVR